jgi:hypothetical protein
MDASASIEARSSWAWPQARTQRCGARIDADGKKIRPPDLSRLRNGRSRLPAPHGSVVFRRAAFDEAGGYDGRCEGWEDGDLYMRLSKQGAIYIVPEVLYRYRYHTDASTLGAPIRERSQMLKVEHRCLERFRDGGDYSDLLDHTSHIEGSGTDDDAYALLAAMRVWSGYRPPRRPRPSSRSFDLTGARMRAMVYSSWGRLSPRTLRSGLSAWIKVRNVVAVRDIDREKPIEWLFERQSLV